jgi:hypothetical protein
MVGINYFYYIKFISMRHLFQSFPPQLITIKYIKNEFSLEILLNLFYN